MCEINPKHSAIYRLEAYTSDPKMSREKFLRIVSEKLLAVEMDLNKDMLFRFHIHDVPKFTSSRRGKLPTRGNPQ